MNVTYHACERYCERFMGMTDKKDIKSYLLDHNNQDAVQRAVLKIFTDASFLYSGIVLRDDPVRIFYINEDTILCLDKESNNILTLYKIDYGYPVRTNRVVIEQLLEEISNLESKLKASKIEVGNTMEEYELALQKVDEEIKNLEEQVVILGKKKYIIQEEIKIHSKISEQISKDIRKYALQLIHSWEYKRDFDKNSHMR